MTATRVEHDGLGPVNDPADGLWAARIQRSQEHLKVAGRCPLRTSGQPGQDPSDRAEDRAVTTSASMTNSMGRPIFATMLALLVQPVCGRIPFEAAPGLVRFIYSIGACRTDISRKCG